MELTKLNDLLDHQDKLQKMVNEVNRNRTKMGRATLDISVLRTEYELAKDIETAKAVGDLATVSTKTTELIAHQMEYGL